MYDSIVQSYCSTVSVVPFEESLKKQATSQKSSWILNFSVLKWLPLIFVALINVQLSRQIPAFVITFHLANTTLEWTAGQSWRTENKKILGLLRKYVRQTWIVYYQLESTKSDWHITYSFLDHMSGPHLSPKAGGKEDCSLLYPLHRPSWNIIKTMEMIPSSDLYNNDLSIPDLVNRSGFRAGLSFSMQFEILSIHQRSKSYLERQSVYNLTTNRLNKIIYDVIKIQETGCTSSS